MVWFIRKLHTWVKMRSFAIIARCDRRGKRLRKASRGWQITVIRVSSYVVVNERVTHSLDPAGGKMEALRQLFMRRISLPQRLLKNGGGHTPVTEPFTLPVIPVNYGKYGNAECVLCDTLSPYAPLVLASLKRNTTIGLRNRRVKKSSRTQNPGRIEVCGVSRG